MNVSKSSIVSMAYIGAPVHWPIDVAPLDSVVNPVGHARQIDSGSAAVPPDDHVPAGQEAQTKRPPNPGLQDDAVGKACDGVPECSYLCMLP